MLGCCGADEAASARARWRGSMLLAVCSGAALATAEADRIVLVGARARPISPIASRAHGRSNTGGAVNAAQGGRFAEMADVCGVCGCTGWGSDRVCERGVCVCGKAAHDAVRPERTRDGT